MDDLRGTRVGGYVVEQMLGAGGMGTVWLARNVVTGQFAAVKVIRGDQLDNAQARQRFVREAVAASQVRHPNVVTILDVSQLADGRYYILMEYLDGIDLDGYVRRFGKLGAEDALRVLAPIAGALEGLHEAGIVHRDLKPSNVMLVRAHAAGEDNGEQSLGPAAIDAYRVKVVDFGLAKVAPVAPSAAVPTRLTHAGLVAGTCGYMAPEQAIAFANVDGRADMYSLGMIACFVLTGRVPFVRDTPDDNLFAVLDRAREQPTEAHELLASEARHAPDAWVPIILKAIAFRAEHRWQLARELPLALAPHVENGDRIVRRLVPQFDQTAPADAKTVKNPRDVLPTEVLTKPPPPAPTTLGGAAGPVSTPQSTSRSRAWAWASGGVVVAVLAVLAVWTAVRSPSGVAARVSDDAAPVAISPAAPPPPAERDIWIVTEPLRANVFADGRPLGRSPARLRARLGDVVYVRAELDGYEEAEQRIDIASAPDEVTVALSAISPPDASVERRTRRRGARQDRDSATRAPEIDAGVTPPSVNERVFDPNNPLPLGPR